MQQGYNVFISYRGAGSGGLLGKEIYTDLKNAPEEKGQPKILPFFAPACIPKGDNFKDTIETVINKVTCVILILSKGFFKNCTEKDDMVRFELKEALKNPNITFIPVIMEGFSFEEELPLIADIFTEEEISRFKHINAINHHGVYDFNTESDVLPTIRKLLALGGVKHITESFKVRESDGKNSNKTALTVGVCAIGVVLVLLLLFFAFRDDNTKKEDNNSVSTVSAESVLSSSQNNTSLVSNNSVQSTVMSSQNTQTSSSAEQKPSAEVNQIPEKYKNEVDALKNSDSLSLANKTLRVKVGEYVTPMAASVWKNVTLYSQNTDVAIGEGLMVKGVSPGETYVIVESDLGSSSAFYVIVE